MSVQIFQMLEEVAAKLFSERSQASIGADSHIAPQLMGRFRVRIAAPQSPDLGRWHLRLKAKGEMKRR
jgi:hypothetical protein